jgi:oxygen-independent coproporphyrinogen-3 oxidase
MLEEKQTIVACGAGATTKRVFSDKNPDGTHEQDRRDDRAEEGAFWKVK